MPDKSEVMMEQMDETRKDLAEKLELLEKKVTGTVESVTDLVESVPGTVETVKETIEETVSSVKDAVEHTVDAVKGSVENTVGAVKNFFDIPHHVDRHPWLMMGGSVLLGFLGGRLLTPRRAAAEPSASRNGSPATPAYTPPAAAPSPVREEPRKEAPARESWLHRLGDQFGGELSKVKGLALGTLLGVARDMVSQWVPEKLKQDVSEIVNNFTKDLGGKVIQGPILEDQPPAAS
jgi:ElaB/YqjD/DUF883 family membrane-anchored ribosome-binding protein